MQICPALTGFASACAMALPIRRDPPATTAPLPRKGCSALTVMLLLRRLGMGLTREPSSLPALCAMAETVGRVVAKDPGRRAAHVRSSPWTLDRSGRRRVQHRSPRHPVADAEGRPDDPGDWNSRVPGA